MGRHSAPRNPCGGVRTHTGSKIIEKEDLLRLANMTMPFGKYKGRRLIDLPEPYLLWMAKEGFPPGQLGAAAAARPGDQDQRPLPPHPTPEAAPRPLSARSAPGAGRRRARSCRASAVDVGTDLEPVHAALRNLLISRSGTGQACGTRREVEHVALIGTLK